MSAVTVTAMEGRRAPTRTADQYFVNAPIDALLIGGASLVLYAVFRWRPHLAGSPSVASLAATLVWVCNYPHFASTNYRLYHSKASIAQYPLTSIVTPLVMVAAVVGCYLSPTDIAPLFIKLYLLWSPYHFSGQTLGITMVYARRAGFVIDGWLRRSLTAFIFLTFAVPNAWAEVGHHVNPFYGVQYPTLGLPIWVARVLTVALWVALTLTVALLLNRLLGDGWAWQAITGIALAEWVVRNLCRQVGLGDLVDWPAGVTWAMAAVAAAILAYALLSSGMRVPWIVVLPALTQFVWFVATPAGQFNYMVPFFHSLQYLLIAWNVQLKEGLAERRRDPSVRYVWSESARWMAINIVGGYVLFWGLPHLGAHFGKPMVFSTAVMLAAIQVHHFFVDGVIWRLRNPAARSPLSSSLRAIAGHA